MNGPLDSSRAPSLRLRLLCIVSLASMVLLVLASALTYRQALHELEELMDGQMAKTGQLMLAQLAQDPVYPVDLAARIAGIRGVRPDQIELALEYQIGTADGTVLARSAQAPATPLSGALGFADVVDGGQAWRSLILEAVDGRHRIQIAESIPTRDEEALEIAAKTMQPLLLFFPLALFAIYFAVRQGLKPLDHLAAEVSARSSDNLSPLATRAVPREVQPLVAAINRLFFRLDGALESERRFTADAAHELRTPLAAARIQAQVGLLSAEESLRRHAMKQTMAGIDRATRLVDQMLRLARLDPLARLPAPQKVDLCELAGDVAAITKDAVPEADIALDVPAGEVPIDGDPGLLEIALRNLLDNAARYSPAGSAITVFLSKRSGELRLGVRDSGPGVSPPELPRLIERFYRGSGTTAEGSGLGLTIVRRIAELHGASLELRNREDAGRVVGFEACLRWDR